MTEEFDKDIDVLLRQTARGETVSENSRFKIQDSKTPHLDADEISAFAENALPEKTKSRLTRHFADCDRCRKILSDLILLNSENEIVPVKETEKIVALTIPWYRKLFLFPNVAYTMGALVLVFSGLVAFVVVRSVDDSQSAEISQISEQPQKGGPFSDDTAIVVEQNANSAAANNSMANASMTNSTPVFSSNSSAMSSTNTMTSNAAPNSAARTANANSFSNSTTASNTAPVSANEAPKGEANFPETQITQKSLSELPLNARRMENLPEVKQEPDKKENSKDAGTTDSTQSPAPKPKSDRRAASENQVSLDGLSLAKKKVAPAKPETTSVRGKTFKRADNIWVDSTYKNQATTNVTRGTKEYKKLDSDLRGIAENLGGTVIVVWKETAYRIQ